MNNEVNHHNASFFLARKLVTAINTEGANFDKSNIEKLAKTNEKIIKNYLSTDELFNLSAKGFSEKIKEKKLIDILDIVEFGSETRYINLLASEIKNFIKVSLILYPNLDKEKLESNSFLEDILKEFLDYQHQCGQTCRLVGKLLYLVKKDHNKKKLNINSSNLKLNVLFGAIKDESGHFYSEMKLFVNSLKNIQRMKL